MRVNEAWFVDIAKSGAGGGGVTEKDMVTEWERVPFVPVTVAK